jgi:hypothetical protein
MGNSGWNCLTNNYNTINSCLLNNKSDNNDNNNTPIGLNLLSKSTPSTNPISYDKQISYNMISPNSIIILSNYKPKGPIITKLRNKKIFTKQLF